ncbi:probable glutathione S-transferase [Elaeis guineensis]|uniref:glutathione transferase n=1 Tax=Elaeis guineensis var. tenera TaxID=51953 RepID=A0A6I9RGH2_ELAGV|nr:probable glutathione S-transferase [Elaeis guineensis]
MEKGDVKLFGIWSSPFVLIVKWALRIKGVEYEYIEEDLSNKSNLLLEYNPVHKKVPVMVHNGKPIAESAVILEYIEETWKNNPILPDDPYERAMARFWCKFVVDKLSPPIWRLFISQGKEQEEAYALAIENLKILEQELQGKMFFCGETIGLADISIGPLAYVMPIYEEITKLKMVDAERFPLLCAWMEAFLNSPVVKDSLPPGEKLLLKYRALRESFLAKGNK